MNLIILAIALPLLAAFLIPVLGKVCWRPAWLAGPVTLLVTLAILTIAGMRMGDTPYAYSVGGFLPPLGISFYMDKMSAIFALAVPVLCLVLWPWKGAASDRVYSLMLLIAASSCGLALSGDLFNLYVFYELVAVASFGLVGLTGTGAAQVATFRYMLISGIGSVMTLTGIALVYTQTGTLNLAHLAMLSADMLDNNVGLVAFSLILLGVGVKAELFPVNTWVPEVYATAPTRVTGLLAGLVSKLAVLMIVRVMVLVFPHPEAHLMMLVLGVLGVLSGEFAAWRATDLKRVLAYSSIGQLGMIFIAFSIPGEAGLMAGLAIALHHMIVKPGMFVLMDRWGGSIQRLASAASASPVAAGLFVLFALSLIGVPPLPGFWAKLLLISGLADSGQGAYLLAMAVVLIATVVEANYFMRILTSLYGEARGYEHEAQGKGSLAISALMAVGLVSATVFVLPVSAALEATSAQAADVQTYISSVFPDGAPLTGGRP